MPELIKRLVTTLNSLGEYEVVFIENGSHDKTADLIIEAHRSNPRIKMVQLSRDFGQAIALRAGFAFVRGDIVVMMDGDLQDLPEEIPGLIAKLSEGFDIVYAQRTGRQDTFFRRSMSRAIRKLLAVLVRGGDLPKGDERSLVGVFRAMTKDVADAIKSLPEHTPYIQGLIRWVGFREAIIPVQHGKRFAGRSKYSVKGLLRYALDGIVTTSTYPLRLITLFGFILSVVAGIIAIWQIFYRIWHGTQSTGFTTLIIAILFIGGIQFAVLGILGEYIGRIYTETKQRPLYIIKKRLL